MHGVAVILWFYAINRIPLAEVTALSYLAPAFVVIGAALFLGEPVKAERVVALAIAFVGVLIILQPGFERNRDGAALRSSRRRRCLPPRRSSPSA